MEKFSFEALNRNGKNLSGVIAAESVSSAREKLKKNGLAILSIRQFECDSGGDDDSLKSFEFEAVNPDGIVRRGIIESATIFDAYQKLRSDFKFEVNYLVPKNATFAEKSALKKKGIDPEFKAAFEFERARMAKKNAIRPTVESIREKREKEMEFFRTRLESLLGKLQLALGKVSTIIRPKKRHEINEEINLLARLRRSNSIEHLEALSKKLLDQVVDPKIFPDSVALDPKSDEERRKFRADVIALRKKFNIDFNALQAQFSKINVKKIGRVVVKINPIRQIFDFFGQMNLFLFACLAFFWIFVAVGIGFDFVSPEKSKFYFHSAVMWYFTMFSGVVAVFFAIFSKIAHPTWKKSVAIATATIFTLAIVSFEFPAIFFWT